MKHTISKVLLLGLFIIACNTPSSENKFPVPTNGLTLIHSSESADNQSKRTEWIESMHRAAPDVDWRSIESENLKAKNKFLNSKPRPKRGQEEEFAQGALLGEWKERGPSNQAGSILATLHDPSDDKVFCISAGGSILKGSLEGNGWEVIAQNVNMDSDYLESIDVNASPRLIGKNARVPHYSDDGGQTWQQATGIQINDETWGRTQIAKLTQSNSNILYALSKPDFWADYSLYKSLDNGQSYQLIRTLTSSKESNYRLFSTENTEDLYFLEKTSDVGAFHLWKYNLTTEQFDMINDDFMSEHTASLVTKPTSVRLANGSNRHYFYTSDDEIVFTEDEGETSIQTGTMPETPWGLIYALPSSPFTLLMGEVDAYRSDDAGSTWTKVNAWYEYYEDVKHKLHADIMSYREITTNDGTNLILAGHHGGLSKSYDALATTENITLDGVSTAQFYDVRTDPTDPNVIYAGSQDQGFQRSSTISQQDIQQFDQLVSGDYGKIAFTNNNQSLWTVYPDGDVAYFENAKQGGGPTNWFTIDSENESVWLPPLVSAQDTDANEILIAGGNINGGTGSHVIKLTVANQEIESDQYAFDFTNDGSGNLSSLAISPIDENLIYAGTEEGAFFYSTDGGTSWNKSLRTLPNGHYLYGAAILPSKVDSDVIYFGGSGYSNTGVLRSRDGGRTFFNIGNTLPQTTVLDLDMNEDGSLIFAATEAGPYVYVTADSRWYDINGIHAPRQSYWSVEYLDGEDIVRFGTHGRGVWDLNINQQNVTINNLPELQGAFNVYPNPSKGNFTAHIQVDKALEDAEYSIYNSIGQKMMSGNLDKVTNQLIDIDITRYPSGIYTLQISDTKGSKTFQLSKQ